MSHPFELKLEDLQEIETDVTEELTLEAAQVVGGSKFTISEMATTAEHGEVGEEGGGGFIKPPGATTNYYGEEGGGKPPIVTQYCVTLGHGETGEGGGGPIAWL